MAGQSTAELFVNARTGQWIALADASQSIFQASGANHAAGLVPDPGSSAGTTKFLREDATWQPPPAAPANTVPNGLTGDTSFTAYAVVCGGTTSTNPLQSVAGLGNSGQVLTSNGAAALPTFQSVASAISPAVQVLTTSQTVTIPTGATKCWVWLVGGGGGGGGATANPCSGGAGGPGGSAGALQKYLSGLTAGNTLVLTIGGAGSAGSNAPGNGGNGGDTTLASGTQVITTLTAGKGSGGTGGAAALGTVGASGTATNGDLNINGATGGVSNVGLFISMSGDTGLGLGPGQAVLSGSSTTSIAGKAAVGFGGGGTGAIVAANQAAQAGAAGTAGAAIFVWFA